MVERGVTVWVFLITSMLMVEQAAFGYFTKDQPMHHFFNSKLLQPGEYQISMYGNFRIGLTETLEVGTNGFGFVLFNKPVANIAVKHEMFRADNYQTSFSSHSLLLPSSLFLSGEEDSNSDHSDARTFLSLHGITTGLEVGELSVFNFGLYDFYVLQQQTGDEASLHVISPSVGLDVVFNRMFGVSLILVQPIYALAQQNTDFGDAESELDFSREDPSAVRFLMATGTISWQTFNLEAGVSSAFGLTSIYINLFWRIRD